MVVIEGKNLKKSYSKSKGIGKVEVIHGINLNVSAGESVGYIGMNGAGKSTTIKMLTGLIPPTEGELSVLGMDPFKQRKKYVRNIGVVFGQRNQLFWDIPVIETFKFHKKIYNLSDDVYNKKMALFDELLKLNTLLNARALTLSLGQRMKCNLALALLHEPKILFLDEATIGLDILVKRDIQNLLKKQVDEGTTLLFTSHDMKDISQICKRIIVLDKGNIMEDMPLKTFIEKYGGRRTITMQTENDEALYKLDMLCKEKWNDHIEAYRVDNNSGQFQIAFYEKQITLPKIMEMIYAEQIPIVHMQLEEDQLEDAIARIYRKK